MTSQTDDQLYADLHLRYDVTDRRPAVRLRAVGSLGVSLLRPLPVWSLFPLEVRLSTRTVGGAMT
jgi:hypothetical protein